MRHISMLSGVLAVVATATPARAFEVKHLLKQVFGSSDPADLGGPIFALIAIAAIGFFWGALRIGRRRQRRLIDSYDEQLQDYASRLRRGKS